jgi:uncharacterized protein YbjT (DUF2867 family)
MKVLVIGAHGGVGEHVMNKLNEKKHQSLAVGSKDNQLEDLKKRGATEAVVYDSQQHGALFQNYDAIIFLTDVNPKTGSDKTSLVDHDAISETIQEAEKQGLKRFILMSAVRANESADESRRNIGIKDMPEKLLSDSAVTCTVVRSSKLTDKPGQGKIMLDETILDDSAEISREDLAEVLVEALDNRKTFNKTFEVSSGDAPIEQALNSL